jgi:hypothetical protein
MFSLGASSLICRGFDTGRGGNIAFSLGIMASQLRDKPENLIVQQLGFSRSNNLVGAGL